MRRTRTTKRCAVCNKSVALYRMRFERSVFRGRKPPIELGAPADYLPEIIRKSTDKVGKKEKKDLTI